MPQLIPSPPIGADPNSYVWVDWYNQIVVVVDYLNDLLAQVDGTASSAEAAAVAAQAAADAAQTAADGAQTAADAAQTAAEDAQAAAEQAQSLAFAAQDTATEALTPDTYTPSMTAGAFYLGIGTATAYIRYNSDGTKSRKANSGSYTGAGNWYNPTTASIGDTHWIKFVKTSESGGTMSGTFGSWLQLNTSPVISISSSSGDAIGTASVQIATDSSGTTVVASGTISVSATQEN